MRVVPKASIARKGAKNINHHMLYITFPFLPASTYRERSFSSLIKHRFLFSMMSLTVRVGKRGPHVAICKFEGQKFAFFWHSSADY